MKRLLLIPLLLLSICFCLLAQDKTYGNIRSAIKAGNAKGLVIFFDNYVELKTDKDEGAYSKKQSELLLSNFFKNNSPTAFNYDYQGTTNNGKKYAIGTYTCEAGNFRVYMKLKLLSNESYVIETLDCTPAQ